jgi:hypothetical protein
LALPQLEAYDDRLVEEWERERDRVEENAQDLDPEDAVIERGKVLYDYLQKNCRPIRPSCTEGYVGRGSYQILADIPRVGWHRDFDARLKALPSPASEEKK